MKSFCQLICCYSIKEDKTAAYGFRVNFFPKGNKEDGA